MADISKINVLTVRESVARARSEGYRITESALRRWIKLGQIPVRQAGRRILIYYPNLLRFLECADSCDNAPSAPEPVAGIRRVEVRP